MNTFEIIGSVSTAAGVILSLFLVIVPSILNRSKSRKKALILINGLILELVVFLRNYFLCSHVKYQIVDEKGEIRIKFQEIKEFSYNRSLFNSIDKIEEYSNNLKFEEQKLFMEFTLELRNIFSGWAIYEEKWVHAYQSGVNIINNLFPQNTWELDFTDNIFELRHLRNKQ